MAFEFKPLQEFSPVDKRRRYLPHWEQEGCTYFLTWRLADSVPETVSGPWKEERETFRRANPKPWDDAIWKQYHARFTRRMEEWLDAGHGTCALREPDLRSIVENALMFFQDQRYALDAWVIMPNHVHALICPHSEWPLERLLHSWKSYTAHEINKRLQQEGVFWMDETFDHIVRSEAHLAHFRNYIRDNPAKAGLREGEFSLWERLEEEQARDTGVPPVGEKPVE